MNSETVDFLRLGPQRAEQIPRSRAARSVQRLSESEQTIGGTNMLRNTQRSTGTQRRASLPPAANAHRRASRRSSENVRHPSTNRLLSISSSCSVHTALQEANNNEEVFELTVPGWLTVGRAYLAIQRSNDLFDKEQCKYALTKVSRQGSFVRHR